MDPSYRIHLPNFSGPIDLLLQLVQKNEVDIALVPLAQITEEYLGYLHLFSREGNYDLEHTSEFLLMAAILMRIKMKTLLPLPEGMEEEEEDPTFALAQRLEEYHKVKDAASWLREREEMARDYFPHFSIHPEEGRDLTQGLEEGEVSLADLLIAFKSILERKKEDSFYEITPILVTVEEKIERILNRLREKESLSFNELFEEETKRIEMIVTFLALLELIRLRRVLVKQSKAFGEIFIKAVPGD